MIEAEPFLLGLLLLMLSGATMGYVIARLSPCKEKVVLGFLVTILIILGLQFWHPWQRQPEVFYAPLILPLETIKGDVIVLSDDYHIVIDRNKRINAIENSGEKVTIKSTIRMNLWELLSERRGK